MSTLTATAPGPMTTRDPKLDSRMKVICQDCGSQITNLADVVDITVNAPRFECKNCHSILPTPAMLAAFPWLKPKSR